MGRLHRAGQRSMTFLGIGSGDGLMEASIALHLAAVLGLAIDLHAGHPLRLMDGDFEITIVATDTPDMKERERNQTADARFEMNVLTFDRRDAVRHFAEQGPIYVFSCWMPMQAEWRADIEEDGGMRIVEICFLSAPPSLIQNNPAEMRSRIRGTAELFPLT